MHLTTNGSISVVKPGVHLVKAEVSELVTLVKYYIANLMQL